MFRNYILIFLIILNIHLSNNLTCNYCDPFDENTKCNDVRLWKTIECRQSKIPSDFYNPKKTLEWLTHRKARRSHINSIEFQCYIMRAGYEHKKQRIFLGCISKIGPFDLCNNIFKIFDGDLKLLVYNCETCSEDNCNEKGKFMNGIELLSSSSLIRPLFIIIILIFIKLVISIN